MRNMRNAFWALGLAGAVYAWKNRDKLRQQFGGTTSRGPQGYLPDYGTSNGQGSAPQTGGSGNSSNWEQADRQRFSGSDI
jgi:hypothetical protein